MIKTKITIVGSGYVGMSLAVLLAQHNEVVVLDIDNLRVDKINNRKSTVLDVDIENYLAKKDIDITATTDKFVAYENASFIVVATPTNYDPISNQFDTTSVDSVVSDALKINKDSLVVIKSTIPVGHTRFLQKKFKTNRVFFSPEFLREGQALKDNLYPSRIIVGAQPEIGKQFAHLLTEAAEKKEIETLFIGPTEAESVKLFANTYLAMRVSFFNELDSFALNNQISSQAIIDGISQDPRIGDHYNNPSFGYGGYCLPKDTKQLLSSFTDTPQALIESVVISNAKRKEFITDNILKLLDDPKGVVGVFRLIMKSNTDNFRSSAVLDIASSLSELGIRVLIYEPNLKEIDITKYSNFKIEDDLDSFKLTSHIIIANRFSAELDDVSEKTYTRDIFNNN